MLERLKNWFKSPIDQIESEIRNIFSFLIDDYGFGFIKTDLGNAVDKNGKFLFYGPLNAYQIYNDHVCIHILYLVQRQDYEIYVTDQYSTDQQYIRNGLEISSYFAYDLSRFAHETKAEITSQKTVCGKEI